MMKRLTVWIVVCALLIFGGAPIHAADQSRHGMGHHDDGQVVAAEIHSGHDHCARSAPPDGGDEETPAVAPTNHCTFCPAPGCGGVPLTMRVTSEIVETTAPPVTYAPPPDDRASGLIPSPPQQPPRPIAI